MRIKTEPELDFDDVLILPKRSKSASRADVELLREFYFYHSNKRLDVLPIACTNMFCTGCFEIAKVFSKFKALTFLHKFYSVDELVQFYQPLLGTPEFEYTWFSMGARSNDLNKLKELIGKLGISPNVLVDVANGQTEQFVDTCARVRDLIGNAILCAGNTVIPEVVNELIIRGGADICRIGLGSGAQCATRKVTGVGRRQLSAIIDCSDAAHGLTSSPRHLGLICSDGGIKQIGDFAKAVGAGSDLVCAGTFWAGTEECIGEWETKYESQPYQEDRWMSIDDFLWKTPFNISHTKEIKDNKVLVSLIKEGKYNEKKKRLKFYGMSSTHAQELHYKGKPAYAASEGDVNWIDYKGPIKDLLDEVCGGLRSFCSYVGAPGLKYASRCTTFTIGQR